MGRMEAAMGVCRTTLGITVIFGLVALLAPAVVFAQSEPLSVEEQSYLEEEEEGDFEALERERTHGYLGIRGEGLYLLSQDLRYSTPYLDHGKGLGFMAGIRLGPVLALEWTWDILFHSAAAPRIQGTDVQLDRVYTMFFGGAVTLNLPTSSAVEPFIQAGGGWAYVGADFQPNPDGQTHVFTHGPTFLVGGGLNFWAGSVLTFGVRASYRGIYFRSPLYEGPGPTYADYIGAAMFDVSTAFHL